MKRSSVSYTKGEIGKSRVVKDFLPPPNKLVLRKPKSRRSGAAKPKRRP
jgi:hypothetical protein